MKKLLIALTILIVIISAVYTGAWFYTKNKVENNISHTLNQLKKDAKFKYVTYDLEVSGFPYLNVELKNIKIKTDKYFSVSKEGFEFRALEENSIKHQIKNIFASAINYNAEQASFDFIVINLDNNQPVTFVFNFDKLGLDLNSKSNSLNIEYADIEASSANAALLAVVSLDNLKASYDIKPKAEELSEVDFDYELSNLKVFDKGARRKPIIIHHSALKGKIINIANMVLKIAEKAKKGQPIFSREVLKSLSKNRTNVIIEDFKVTTDFSQMLFKGQILLDADRKIRTNFDSSIKFLVEKNMLENILKAYKLEKTENGTYFINGRTNEKEININNVIVFERPRI